MRQTTFLNLYDTEDKQYLILYLILMFQFLHMWNYVVEVNGGHLEYANTCCIRLWTLLKLPRFKLGAMSHSYNILCTMGMLSCPYNPWCVQHTIILAFWDLFHSTKFSSPLVLLLPLNYYIVYRLTYLIVYFNSISESHSFTKYLDRDVIGVTFLQLKVLKSSCFLLSFHKW